MTEEFLHVCLIPGCTRNKQPFGNRPNLKRHLREGHHGVNIDCPECGVNYTDPYNLQSHLLYHCRQERRRQKAGEASTGSNGGSATASLPTIVEPGLVESAQSDAMDTASPSTAEEPTTVGLSTMTAESLIDSRRASKRPLQDGGQERKRSSQDLCQARKRHAGDAGRSPLYAHRIATSSWPQQRLGHGACDDCSTTSQEPQPDWSSASLTGTS
jgi:hypothetical protein